MICEFKVLRADEFDNDVGDSPMGLEMDRVEAAYPAMGDDLGCTIIQLKSSFRHTIRIEYEEFMSIWQTCVNTIKLD